MREGKLGGSPVDSEVTDEQLAIEATEALKNSMRAGPGRPAPVNLAKDLEEVIGARPPEATQPPVFRKITAEERATVEGDKIYDGLSANETKGLTPFQINQLAQAKALEQAEIEEKEADIVAEEEMEKVEPLKETEEEKRVRLLREQRLAILYAKYGKDETNAMAQFEGILPKGYSLEQALIDKGMYGAIYLQHLPSGPYVFRPLTKMDMDSIRKMKGMTEERVPQEVVQMCVLSPKISKVFIQTSSAGTLKTLADIVYMYSDFIGPNTESPIKL